MEATRVPDEDGIHSVLLTRTSPSVPWGVRLQGGQDEGISLKLCKVSLESPAGRAGLLAKDLLVTVQGVDVLDRSHEEVVTLIKKSGKELRITMERGENLIPNMSMLCRPEDWVAPAKEPNFYLVAATEDITVPNSYRKKEKVFTTAGAPKIETEQYNQPMGLYSAETVARMADTVEIDAKLNGTGDSQDRHFDPEQSSVLDMILQDDEKEMRELGMSGYPDFGSSASNSRTQSRADSMGSCSRRGSLLPNPNPFPGMEIPTQSAQPRRGSLAVTGSLPVRTTALALTQKNTTSTGQLANLVMDEEAERRGMRKVSMVMQGDAAYVKDRRLAVSEGRYGDLGFKSIV